MSWHSKSGMGEAATEYGQPNIKAAQPSREPKLPGELHPQMHEREPSQPGIRGPPERATAALCFSIQGFVGVAGPSGWPRFRPRTPDATSTFPLKTPPMLLHFLLAGMAGTEKMLENAPKASGVYLIEVSGE
jgi:hypothetical protein